jgi:putative flippase GtrA
MKNEKSAGLIQFIKFGMVGISNTAVDWVVFFLLRATIIDPTIQGEKNIGKAVSFFVAMLNSYLWNTIWTFKKEYQGVTAGTDAKKKKGIVFGKFVVASVIGWGINVFFYDLVSTKISWELLGKQDLLALVVASGSAIVWNFLSNKFWTYKKY